MQIPKLNDKLPWLGCVKYLIMSIFKGFIEKEGNWSNFHVMKDFRDFWTVSVWESL